MHLWCLELGRLYFVTPTFSIHPSLSLPLSPSLFPSIHLSPFSLLCLSLLPLFSPLLLFLASQLTKSALGAGRKPLIPPLELHRDL